MPTPGWDRRVERQGPYLETWRNEETQETTIINDNPVGSRVLTSVDQKWDTSSGKVSGSGWKFPTPWTRKVFEFVISTSRSAVYTDYGYSLFADNVAWDNSVTSDYPFDYDRKVLEDRAIVAALKQLRGKGPDILTVIGERHETLRLFTNGVKTIFDAYRAFKRNNPSDWLKVLRHDVGPLHKMPASWLAVQFGIRPIVNDVQNSMEYLHNLAKGLPPMAGVKGRSTETLDREFEGGGSTYCQMKIRDRGTVKCLVRLDYSQSDGDIGNLGPLGLTNPFIAGWELLPWSFVVDYMSNVGDVISSWGSDFGWDFMSGSCSITERYERKGTAYITNKNYGGYCNDTVRGKSVYFTRDTYLSSPLPGFHFKDPASYAHVANLVALASAKLTDSSFKTPR